VAVGRGVDTGAGDFSSIQPENINIAAIATMAIKPVMDFVFHIFPPYSHRPRSHQTPHLTGCPTITMSYNPYSLLFYL